MNQQGMISNAQCGAAPYQTMWGNFILWSIPLPFTQPKKCRAVGPKAFIYITYNLVSVPTP